MSCSPFDLKDYVLDELGADERRATERHLNACTACREELERLGLTRAALLTLPDEEIPQKIAFVSDPVFEPGPLRRWFRDFWGSAARLGFASAALLSAALVVSALLMRPAPAPAPQPAQVDLAGFEAQVAARISQAVAESDARHAQELQRALAAAEQRHTLELKAIQLSVEESFTAMQKRLARYYVASAGFEARP